MDLLGLLKAIILIETVLIMIMSIAAGLGRFEKVEKLSVVLLIGMIIILGLTFLQLAQ